MKYSVTVEIAAPPERVWAVLADVARWPVWSPTMDEVRRLDGGPFGPGSAAEVRQPKLPKQIWRVTEFEPGRRFEWATGAPGVTTSGDHVIEPLDSGRCRVTLGIETTGPLALPVWLLLGALIRRYVALEAASLKRHCEHPATTP